MEKYEIFFRSEAIQRGKYVNYFILELCEIGKKVGIIVKRKEWRIFIFVICDGTLSIWTEVPKNMLIRFVHSGYKFVQFFHNDLITRNFYWNKSKSLKT